MQTKMMVVIEWHKHGMVYIAVERTGTVQRR